MTTLRLTNSTRGTVLGTRIRLADDIPSRIRGFLFRPPPAHGEGILLSPCKAVHMFGVRFALDVVFISEQGGVVATYPELKPWRRSAIHGSALHALEVPPGTIRATGTATGDQLSWTAAGAEADAAAEALMDIEPDIERHIEATAEPGAESRPEPTRRQA